MEDVLRKSASGLGIGFLCLLILLGTGSSYAKSSFKNTPLYRHVVKRAGSQPATLYEDKQAASAEQAEVAETSSNQKVIVAEKGKPAAPASLRIPAGPTAVPLATRSPVRLADPSTFTPQMPLSEAVEILRNSTLPKLNIVVLWKDLQENADIYPDTPIGIDGVSGVSLNRHLKSLVDGISGGAPEKLGYVVEDGVIIIATLPSLPHRMVTRTYDVTDLMGQPSTGFPQFGMGMMGMGMPGMMGMGMPGMGMGMGMPFGGGYGMQGGLMPGLGGGFGNFGTGFGNFGSGYGNYGTGLGTSIGSSLGLGGIRY